ncbi:MAG: phosphoribosylanthranilate isomerase [Cyanobacteria bacterium P01_A01_bin.135]
MQVKICGITQVDQAQAIAKLGATALGFICVPESSRFVRPEQIRAIAAALQADAATASVQRIGVFVDRPVDHIRRTVDGAQLTGIQLHGDESLQTCRTLKQALPGVTIIKALRVRSPETLKLASAYADGVDALLLDAFHPQSHGGTGQTLDWRSLRSFHPPCPWFLAGGLKPDNVALALAQVSPTGIDLSSGVEKSPGDKDIEQAARLFQALKAATA